LEGYLSREERMSPLIHTYHEPSSICRSVLGWKEANSEEFESQGCENVVVFMPEIDPKVMGGTMRLGQRATRIDQRYKGKRTLASLLYRNAEGRENIL